MIDSANLLPPLSGDESHVIIEMGRDDDLRFRAFRRYTDFRLCADMAGRSLIREIGNGVSDKRGDYTDYGPTDMTRALYEHLEEAIVAETGRPPIPWGGHPPAPLEVAVLRHVAALVAARRKDITGMQSLKWFTELQRSVMAEPNAARVAAEEDRAIEAGTIRSPMPGAGFAETVARYCIWKNKHGWGLLGVTDEGVHTLFKPLWDYTIQRQYGPEVRAAWNLVTGFDEHGRPQAPRPMPLESKGQPDDTSAQEHAL